MVGNIILTPTEVLELIGNSDFSWLEDFVGSSFKETWLLEYYIHPSYWGLGLGYNFTNFLVRNFFEQGFSLLATIVKKDNFKSIQILEKMGFTAHPKYLKQAELFGLNDVLYLATKNKKDQFWLDM